MAVSTGVASTEGALVLGIVQRLLAGPDLGVRLVAGLDQGAPSSCRPRHWPRPPCTMRSISACERPPEAWILICCSLPVRLVLGRDVDDAVGVDVEGDLDLRHAARRGRNADEIELAEQLVVGRHFALALEDPDGDRALVVFGGREHLALLGGNGRVALDEAREHAAQRLDAERQRGHVEQQHVLDVALQHAGLDGGADRHHLVGIDALVGAPCRRCRRRSPAPWACASCRRRGPLRRCPRA